MRKYTSSSTRYLYDLRVQQTPSGRKGWYSRCLAYIRIHCGGIVHSCRRTDVFRRSFEKPAMAIASTLFSRILPNGFKFDAGRIALEMLSPRVRYIGYNSFITSPRPDSSSSLRIPLDIFFLYHEVVLYFSLKVTNPNC